jgi:hypothetical protein
MNIFQNLAICASDFVHFVETCVKILHPVKGLVPFTVHEYHKNLIKTYEDKRFVMVKKFRNGGFTTISLLYGLWKCLFHENQKWLIVAKTDREAVDLANCLQRMIEHFPEPVQTLLTHKSDHVKKFGLTNSSMTFQAVQAINPKGMTHCIFDETAFIPNFDQHWRRTWSHLLENGKCFFVSTVNGFGNWFYETWRDSVEGRNRMTIFEAHYSEHPDHKNEEYLQHLKECLGVDGWNQEMECIFVDKKIPPEDEERQKKKQLLLKLINELFDE